MPGTSLAPTRRAFVLGSATLLGVACTPSRPPAPPQEAAIFDLSLAITDRRRRFALVAPGFVAVERGPQLGSQRPDGIVRHDSGPAAPFAAVELRVTPERDGATAVAGLEAENGDRVLVRWSGAGRRVTIEVRTAGRTHVLRRRTRALEGAFGLALGLCENQVTALVDTGSGWEPVLTERDRVAALVDLRREDVLAGYRYAWGGSGVRLDEVRAGLFGMTGLRDPHLVQHADGTAYERDGRTYLTWTCAGLGFFQQAHWTVWSLDAADPTDMRLEAQLFSRRDGLVLGDHAGQLVRDGDRWLVATSSWGDFEPGSIHVRHTETTADLLSGVHVLDTGRTPLPTDVGSWDPALTRVDGRWHVGFVESPSQGDPFDFHPVLARTSAPTWHADLETVLSADDLHQCEGPIIATVQGTTWFLASDGDARHYPVYDLDGERVGRLDAAYPTNIPHPQLLADPAGGWWMVTFEGTQYAEDVMGYGGHGDVVLLHSRGATS